jgi:hypothetical protein
MKRAAFLIGATVILTACGAQSGQGIRSADVSADQGLSGVTGTLEPVPTLPPLPREEPEFDGQNHDYSLQALWMQGQVSMLCRGYGESYPPTCNGAVLIDAESAEAFARAFKEAVKIAVVTNVAGRSISYSEGDASLNVNGVMKYDPKLGAAVFSGKLVSLDDVFVAAPVITLYGRGEVRIEQGVDVEADLRSIELAITPTRSVQIYGAADGGFLIWSTVPLSEAAVKILEGRLSGHIVVESFFRYTT